MPDPYDSHYETENLFGEASPELLDFFDSMERAKVLDLGCGQGRDALALAKMGFKVLGIDRSKTGIQQMLQQADQLGLHLEGKTADIYQFEDFEEFDFILLDSMFHFLKKDRENESKFLRKIISGMKPSAHLVISIMDMGSRVSILKSILKEFPEIRVVLDRKFKYKFIDQDNGQSSVLNYRLIVGVRK